MFESILRIFKKMNKKDGQVENKTNKDEAKERLHLVLMQDRANVSADFLDLMRQEIIDVIKKYIDVDEKDIDVRLTNKQNSDGTTGAPALYANIPIKSIKNETKKLVNENEKKDKINEDTDDKPKEDNDNQDDDKDETNDEEKINDKENIEENIDANKEEKKENEEIKNNNEDKNSEEEKITVKIEKKQAKEKKTIKKK